MLTFPGGLERLLSKIKMMRNVTPQFTPNSLQYRKLNVKNVKVIILNVDQVAKKKISCLLVKDVSHSQNNLNYVNNLCEDVYRHRPAYKPMHNELCLVSLMKSNKTSWYRARAVKWADDAHLIIELLDIGCHRVVQQSAIRQFDQEFLFDILIIDCILPEIVEREKLVERAKATANEICLIDSSSNTHKILLDWETLQMPTQN